MIAQNVFFWIISAAMAFGAVRMVTVSNVIHAALYLMIVLAGAAGLFILLGSEFLAATQVLVYLGAILVLFVFGIMLTRAPIGKADNLNNSQRPVAALVGVMLFGVLGWILWKAFGNNYGFVLEASNSDEMHTALTPQRTLEVGRDVFENFLIPLQVVGVLLLAALVGAVTIARKD